MRRIGMAITASMTILGVLSLTGCGGSSSEPQVKPVERLSYFIYGDDHKTADARIYLVNDTLPYDDAGIDYEVKFRGIHVESPTCTVMDDGFPEEYSLSNLGTSGTTISGKVEFKDPCYDDRLYFKADKVVTEKDSETGETLNVKITPVTIEIPERGGTPFSSAPKKVVISPADLRWDSEKGLYVLKTKIAVEGGVPGSKVVVGGGFPKLLPGILADDAPKAMFLTETPNVIYDKGSLPPDRGTIVYYGTNAVFSAGGFYDLSIAVPDLDRVVILPSPSRRIGHYLGSYLVKDVLDGERLLLEGFPPKASGKTNAYIKDGSCGCETPDGLGSLPFALVSPSRFDPYNGTLATLAVRGMHGETQTSGTPWTFILDENGETDFDLYLPNFAVGKEIVLWADYFDPVGKIRYSNVFANTIIDSIEQPSSMSCSDEGGCRFGFNLSWSGSGKYVSYSNVVVECEGNEAAEWRVYPEKNLISPGVYHTPGDGNIGFYVKPTVEIGNDGKKKVNTATLTCTISPAKEYLF